MNRKQRNSWWWNSKKLALVWVCLITFMGLASLLYHSWPTCAAFLSISDCVHWCSKQTDEVMDLAHSMSWLLCIWEKRRWILTEQKSLVCGHGPPSSLCEIMSLCDMESYVKSPKRIGNLIQNGRMTRDQGNLRLSLHFLSFGASLKAVTCYRL